MSTYQQRIGNYPQSYKQMMTANINTNFRRNLNLNKGVIALINSLYY